MIISAWLEQLGLGQYATAFETNAIDAETLPKLTAEDLKEIGVAALAHRKKILEAIAALSQSTSHSPLLATTSAAMSRAPPLARPREAERRQLSVMFVDLVGSTGLSTRLDPEEMGAILGQFQDAVAGEVARFDGYIAKLMGDGVLAYFGWPEAHENEAERAVQAGLAVVKTVGALSTNTGHQLSCRVGIATGLVVVGELVGAGPAQENAVVGETPNLASRLQTLAEPGTVLISELTFRLIGKLFEVKRIRPQKLHGFDTPTNSYQVIGVGRAEGRFEALHAGGIAPLVGRELDIALLVERWKLAGSGEGQVVELFGEAGIGKSRILQELRERLKGEPITYLRYFCSPYHTQSALYPVAEHLLRVAAIDRTDPPEKQLAFLEEALATTQNPQEAIPLFASMLSIPFDSRYPKLDMMPQKQKARTFEVLIEQLEALAANKPVLMLLEDAHFMDPVSGELFDIIVGRMQRLPIMLVATYRPEGNARWNGFPHATLLTLNRLSRAQTASIISAMAGGKRLPTPVLEQILSKTEGVPLFVEELTKVVMESGLLRESDGDYRLSGPLPPLAVPATLHDSLMARLDRLASVREVAQIGAVIGREFSHDLLAAACGLSEIELEHATNQLVVAGLVFRRGGGSQISYAFKHALVQDAAYESLLLSRRQQLHARIAQILEEHFPETVASEPELLAHHFGRASLVEKALEYQELAGRRALSRSSLSEALIRFQSALDGLKNLPASKARSCRELSVQVALGSTQVALHGFAAPETGAAYKRAQELCEEVGAINELFPALYGLCLYHLYAAELEEARRVADKLLDLANGGNERGLSFFAHRAAGVSALPAGEFSRARVHLNEALALYDPREHRSPAFVYAFDPRVVCLDYLSRALLPLGFPDQALAANDEAAAEARKIGHRNSLALPLFFGGVIHQILGDCKGAKARAAELAEISSEAGFRFWKAGASILEAWARADEGETERGRAELKRGVSEWRSTGARYMSPYFTALEAQIELKAGNPEAALRLLEEAQNVIEQTNERWYAAEVIRLQGEAMLQLGLPQNLAGARFEEALVMARAQDARFWELRAALGLARVGTGDPRARKRVASIFSSLTEGMALPDLKAAKILTETAASA